MKKTLKKIKFRLEEWFFEEGINKIHYYFEKITGCWAYLHFIWTQEIYREWDYGYLYDLIAFKLERMARQLKADSYVEGYKKTYQDIEEAIRYYKVYDYIERGLISELPCQKEEEVDYNKLTERQHLMWNKFHDTLRDKSQRWWS